MRSVKLQSLKKLWVASNIALKTVLISSILLIAIVVALFTPWYSVQSSQTSTSVFEVPTTSYQTVTIYNLPNPVNLTPITLPNVGYVCTCWFSQNFTLQAGSTYSVNVVFGSGDSLVMVDNAVTGSDIHDVGQSGVSTFVAPTTGQYNIYLYTFDGKPGSVYTVSITASQAQNGLVTETTYRTSQVTASVPPYTTLGLTTSATVLALLALIVALCIVFERQKQRRTRS